ncbi:MAG TPA: ankyrin repeat domain-containing protein, partial [Hyphomicrobiaceae bacterium]|nr:ankyrin repeat domain-containing protein [Hyphomicrobiaceae bacterium]
MAFPTNPVTPDQAFIDFAQEVFKLARTGDAQTLARLLQKGLPPNMSNHKGDTLLMLAAYHGHVEATRKLLEAGAEPDRYNDMA